MTIANFFIVPSGLQVTQFSCRSGNVYSPVNNILTNVAQIDISDVLALGARQVGGPDAGANLPWVAGRFYLGVKGVTPVAFQTVASTIYAYPFRSPGNVPVQTMGINVTTGETGGLVRGGLYADLNGTPGALVAGSDTGSLTATGTAMETFTPSSPITLNEGWYWAAVAASASSTMPLVSGVTSAAAAEFPGDLGFDTAAHAIAASGQFPGGVSATFTYAAMPATFPTAGYALALGAGVPLIVLGT